MLLNISMTASWIISIIIDQLWHRFHSVHSLWPFPLSLLLILPDYWPIVPYIPETPIPSGFLPSSACVTITMLLSFNRQDRCCSSVVPGVEVVALRTYRPLWTEVALACAVRSPGVPQERGNSCFYFSTMNVNPPRKWLINCGVSKIIYS